MPCAPSGEAGGSHFRYGLTQQNLLLDVMPLLIRDPRGRNGVETMANVFTNDMVAHVWAQQTQDEGRSGNGQFYFRGRTLYSYGSHFPVGTIMGRTVALNADSYSPTTSQHQSRARRAVRHLARVELPKLRDIVGVLENIADYPKSARDESARNAVRRYILAHAESLVAHYVLAPDAWEPADDAPTAAEWLAGLVGLKAAPIVARARKLAEMAKRNRERAEVKSRRMDIARMADLPADDFRRHVSHILTQYSAESRLVELGRQVRRLRNFALHDKTISAKRVDALRARLKYVESIVADFARNEARAKARASYRSARLTLRRFGFGRYLIGRREPESSGDWRDINRAASTAVGKSEFGVGRPSIQAAALALVSRAHDEEVKALERETAKRFAQEAERRAEWLAGGRAAGYGSRLSDNRGGALLRIKGDVLETSWGASVPLAHAIKAFRFIKMCKDAGKPWNRNGHVIRVGHFTVDRIEPSGDMVAGCHRFNWPEIERIAALAGVADVQPSNEALESTHA